MDDKIQIKQPLGNSITGTKVTILQDCHQIKIFMAYFGPYIENVVIPTEFTGTQCISLKLYFFNNYSECPQRDGDGPDFFLLFITNFGNNAERRTLEEIPTKIHLNVKIIRESVNGHVRD